MHRIGFVPCGIVLCRFYQPNRILDIEHSSIDKIEFRVHHTTHCQSKILYCIVVEPLYSASDSIEPYRSASDAISSMKTERF